MVEIKSLRILVVTARPHVAQVLRQVLGICGVTDIAVCAHGAAALDLLRHQVYDAVFCDQASSHDTGRDFAKDARTAEGVLDSMIPVFLVSGGPRRRDVEAARDRGYTDVIARPVSAATVLRKLNSALERPRPFIAAPDFFGPDRRSSSRGQFKGRERRARQPRKVRISPPLAPAE
ncbi:MAG TPA: response regulator [Rhizomicrobium sp.]|nr:response regulator [Rhizomicrobium sp.]